MKARLDGRKNDELREVEIIPNFIMHPAGSVLVRMGNTKVICTASVEGQTAAHLRGTGKGWVTAEYGMLPGSTETRKKRDRGKTDGRSVEIQRLIGRSLRSVVNMDQMGEISIWIDCDVIQADGGTRTASITGAYVAMIMAFRKLKKQGLIPEIPVKNYLSAISVGVIDGQARLDLPYEEDSRAEVDMNVVMTDIGDYIELQGTGEKRPFKPEELSELLCLAGKGCRELIEKQKKVLEELEHDEVKNSELNSGVTLDIDSAANLNMGGTPPQNNADFSAVPDSAQKIEVVAATQNPHKLLEIRTIMEPFGMNVISQNEAGLGDIDVKEDGATFEENSYKKAYEIMKRSDKIAIADDSGLSVDTLAGAPGVYSARFAGEEKNDDANNKKLLRLLDKEENRRAKFVSVVTLVYPDGKSLSARGECPGTILRELRGDQGFGYDPMFQPDGYDKTFGELNADVKNTISHRAKALQKLEELLKAEQK